MTTVTLRRVTERITEEIEIRGDDEPGRVIEITRTLRSLTRRGPRPARTIDVTPLPAVVGK